MSDYASVSYMESGTGITEAHGFYDVSPSVMTQCNNLTNTNKNNAIFCLPVFSKCASSFSDLKAGDNKPLDFFYKSQDKIIYDNSTEHLDLNNVSIIVDPIFFINQIEIKRNPLIESKKNIKKSFADFIYFPGEYLSDIDNKMGLSNQEITLSFVRSYLPSDIVDSVINDFYEPGMISRLEQYLTETFDENASGIVQHIMWDLYQYSNYENNNNLMVNVLIVLSELPFSIINDALIEIACNALESNDPELEELGIRCFENWDDKSGISYLKKYSYSESWLDDYAQSVCVYLESL